MSRGGLQFILIIWLQGIWLPLHGYDFERTPLWAGIYMLPLIGGFLVAGPVSGALSDRYGPRLFATTGLLIAALSFVLLMVLPVNFSYPAFAFILALNGIGMGMFASPNSAGVMNSLPPDQRGAGSGMLATFQNSASVLSIGVFFTLMIIGLSSHLPQTMQAGLIGHGVPGPTPPASPASHRSPPCSRCSSATTRWRTLLGPAGAGRATSGAGPGHRRAQLLPQLISGPFHDALVAAFIFAIAACLVAAVASQLRGGTYHHVEPENVPAEPAMPDDVTSRQLRGVEPASHLGEGAG